MTPEEMKKLAYEIEATLGAVEGLSDVAFVNPDEIDGTTLPVICFRRGDLDLALELSLA